MATADAPSLPDLGEDHATPQAELTPLRIALVYLVFGFAALYVSDVLFARHLSEPLLSQVQALKGGLEVVLTGVFIFVLTRRSRRQLARANDRLQRQRDELGLLHRVLRHNLRNDINVVHGYVELVGQCLSTEEAQSHCQRALSAAEEMARYVEGVQRIRKVTEGGRTRRPLDLAEAVPRVVEASGVAEAADVTVSVPDSARVEANPMFEEALAELLYNAVEHADSDSPTVRVTVESGPDGTALRVVDDGPGIPEAEVAALRERESDPLEHPSGVGLWFVDWVVSHSGGRLEITSPEGGGTAVHVHLPDA